MFLFGSDRSGVGVDGRVEWWRWGGGGGVGCDQIAAGDVNQQDIVNATAGTTRASANAVRSIRHGT